MTKYFLVRVIFSFFHTVPLLTIFEKDSWNQFYSVEVVFTKLFVKGKFIIKHSRIPMVWWLRFNIVAIYEIPYWFPSFFFIQIYGYFFLKVSWKRVNFSKLISQYIVVLYDVLFQYIFKESNKWFSNRLGLTTLLC